MTREQRLATAFVGLADTFSEDFDPLGLFQRLVGHCVSLLDIDAAAVMVTDARGMLRTMAASTEEAAFLELLQLQSGSGPCLDCHRTGSQVAVADIAAERERWPRLADPVLRAGYRSLHAVPLRLHERTLGAVNFFRASAGELPEVDRQLGQALADVTAVALLQWTEQPARTEEILTRVQSMVSAKAELEMAKGMIAQYAGIGIPEAAAVLRAYTDLHRVRPTDVARALTRRSLSPAEVLEHH